MQELNKSHYHKNTIYIKLIQNITILYIQLIRFKYIQIFTQRNSVNIRLLTIQRTHNIYQHINSYFELKHKFIFHVQRYQLFVY